MSDLTKIDIVHAKKLTTILSVEISSQSTILDVKKAIEAKKSNLYPDRQMLKFDATGKPLKDEESLSNLKLKDSDAKTMKLYFKDLGPQVGWSTVNLIKMNFVVNIKKINIFGYFKGIFDRICRPVGHIFNILFTAVIYLWSK